MQTRFQASGPRIRYVAKEPLKPFKQMVGLYNMWQALSPETREWLAGLFKSDKDKMMDEPADMERDPILDAEMYTGADTYKKDYDNVMESWEGMTPTTVKVGVNDPYDLDWTRILQ